MSNQLQGFPLGSSYTKSIDGEALSVLLDLLEDGVITYFDFLKHAVNPLWFLYNMAKRKCYPTSLDTFVMGCSLQAKFIHFARNDCIVESMLLLRKENHEDFFKMLTFSKRQLCDPSHFITIQSNTFRVFPDLNWRTPPSRIIPFPWI